MAKITEEWLIYTFINGKFTPLSKPLKSRKDAEKERLRYSEYERKAIAVGSSGES
jgi:hypothetical protein